MTSKLNLSTGLTATGAGTAIVIKNHAQDKKKVYVAYGTTSSGAGSATVAIQGSLDGLHWATIGTISLTLATTESAGVLENQFPYDNIRVNITAISGTGASVTVDMGS